MGKPFSSERLLNIRRMRKARRLYRQLPLFAFELLRSEYEGYSYELFLDDLRYRRPRKKRKGKSQLLKYGRFKRMEKMVSLFKETGKPIYGLQAQQLRRNMSKSYRVRAKVKDDVIECQYSALIPIERIEELVRQLADCKTIGEAEKKMDEFEASSHRN